MGYQSSRIIWGRDKSSGPGDPQAVSLYDPDGTVYVSGNYAIYDSGRGRVASDYHLYLCTASETGGYFNSSDWKEQLGVKNWYLQSRRNYKKGARVIKEDTNGDFETMKLYRCINGMSQPNVWKDSEWEVVKQDVSIAYQARDHKDVYYDSASNDVKWHKKMYFMPPDEVTAPDFSEDTEYVKGDQATYNEHVYQFKPDGPYKGPWIAKDWVLVDNKVWSEVTVFDPEWQYHYKDKIVYNHIVQGWGLYEFRNVAPHRGEWSAGYWDKYEGVTEYEPHKAYKKDDMCIKLNIEILELVITEFQPNCKYAPYKHCLHVLDNNTFGRIFDEWEVYYQGDAVIYNGHRYIYNRVTPRSGEWDPSLFRQEDLFPLDYQERIANGETIYGLFETRQSVNDSEWIPSHWQLLNNQSVQIKGKTYNTSGNYIMQYESNMAFSADDLCIWACDPDSSNFGLNAALVDMPYGSSFAPPREGKWTAVSEILDGSDQHYAFKALRDISAEDNQSWQPKNWAVLEQKIDPDDGLYGIIWEKYGIPGGGGSPFGYAFTTYGGSMYYSGNRTDRRGKFAYFLVDSTTAKFNTFGTYTVRTDYSPIPDLLESDFTHTLSGSAGFTSIITKSGLAYGLFDWDSRDLTDYIYVKLFDDWTKVDLNGNYIQLDRLSLFFTEMSPRLVSFTAVEGGFISLKVVPLYNLSGHEHSFHTKLAKFIISPEGSCLGSTEIELPDILIEPIHYNFYSRYVAYYNRELIYARSVHYTDDIQYYISGGMWYYPLSLSKSFIITENGATEITEDAIVTYENYIYAYFSQQLLSKIVLDDIYEHCAIETRSVEKDDIHDTLTMEQFRNVATTMGLTIREEHVEGTYYRYWLDDCPVNALAYIYEHKFAFFDGLSSGNYEVEWTSYGYYDSTDSDVTYKLRTTANLRVLNRYAGATDYTIYENIFDTGATSSELRTASYTDTPIVIDKEIPLCFKLIGRISNAFYLYVYSPYSINYNGYNASNPFITFSKYNIFKEIWAVDISSRSCSVVNKNGFDRITLRYINNGYVFVNSHKVTHITLLLSSNGYERHRVTYDARENPDEGNNIVVYIPITDANLFSNSTSSSAATFTGSVFLTDWIDDGYSYGIYIYLPIFSMKDKTIMEATGFFWMSSGNGSEGGTGDFYGGYNDRNKSFNLPLVF